MPLARIAGFGYAVPNNVVTNNDMEKIVDTSDKWIHQRTGISERRITDGQKNIDFGIEASIKALDSAGLKGQDIDLIIYTTCTPDRFTPTEANLVQSAIGAKNCMAFTINVACSGFAYGIDLASTYIQAKKAKNVLLVSSEVLSKVVDWTDRNTCVLFGDGAGAVVIKSSKVGVLDTICASKGDEELFLDIPALGNKNPFMYVNEHIIPTIKMDGKNVFKFATRVIPTTINTLLKRNDVTLDEIKYIVPHQANTRIVEAAAKKLKVDVTKFYMNLNRFGNTSSASIPIALAEMNEKGLINRGDKIIIIGFGGGLSWGGALIQF